MENKNPFTDVLKDYILTGTAAKKHLTFEEQCGYYGALLSGVPYLVVAAAAGIAGPTASYLARAGSRVSGQIRYPKVAAEFAALGKAAFIHRYVTPTIHARCLTELSNHEKGLLEPRLTGRARTSRAKGYAGVHILKPRSEFTTETWRIKIFARAGQWFAAIIGSPMRGQVEFEHAQKLGPFATDRDCYLAARKQLTPNAEEM